MITRRYIRVKAFQAVYAFFQTDKADLGVIRKNAVTSCDRMLDLYGLMLSLFTELLQVSRLQIEKNKQKRLPTEEDLNPNLKFVENKLLLLIENNTILKELQSVRKIDWASNGEVIRTMYKKMIKADFYIEYLEDPETSYEKDRVLLIEVFEKIITSYEPLYEITDAKNMYWYDDIAYVNATILNTLTLVNSSNKESFLVPESAIKNEEDELFLIDLIVETISRQEEYSKTIIKLAKNWDFDRIAVSDRILMMMSFTEILVMPSIPKKVTINEYLDMAKSYSTEKSHAFINGIIDKAVKQFEADGLVNKSGRGLL